MARLTPDIIVSAAIEVIGKLGAEQFSVRKLGEAIDADPNVRWTITISETTGDDATSAQR